MKCYWIPLYLAFITKLGMYQISSSQLYCLLHFSFLDKSSSANWYGQIIKRHDIVVCTFAQQVPSYSHGHIHIIQGVPNSRISAALWSNWSLQSSSNQVLFNNLRAFRCISTVLRGKSNSFNTTFSRAISEWSSAETVLLFSIVVRINEIQRIYSESPCTFLMQSYRGPNGILRRCVWVREPR